MNQLQELQVGDKIMVTSPFNRYTVEIERITKTKAISKPINNAGARLEFRRQYTDYLKRFSPVRLDTTTFKLIK